MEEAKAQKEQGMEAGAGKFWKMLESGGKSEESADDEDDKILSSVNYGGTQERLAQLQNSENTIFSEKFYNPDDYKSTNLFNKN